MGVTSCLQVQLLPLLDSETTPRGIKVLFSRLTHRSPFGNSLVRFTAAECWVSGERQVWELVQHLPRAETPPAPPACPGAGGLQVCPGNPLLRVQEVLYRSLFSVGP